ncbi:MAG: geranyl transferase [Candidatus Muproteobacteria bacterium RBG_16_64_11]|uniref:Geranyl transferase n=1 Tax=Candidatus Muproteobacteria bacterium RBG_16_64_11 TaxID=1817758 RepID=A0A1F6TIJ7_9PROT|nr:MAG: geranyl transferase [Candidatus Muproteobacteria bacterium RBG_16_64_11]
MNRFEQTLARYRQRVERALDRCLPPADTPPARLHTAMRYACLAGGKRLRASLVYATGESLGVPIEALDAPACAVECLHAYSLVHDDLPTMDNDDLRRGKPTCHKAFDEATALLVGDALQSLAFEILANDTGTGAAPARRLQMIAQLAHAAGSKGMAGGQAIDLASVGKTLTAAELEAMHLRKTGALITAAVRLGALAHAATPDATLERLADYGRCLGLAVQITDDILDIEADTATLGKPQGSDAARAKPTYPAILGLEAAKSAGRDLHRQALASLGGLGDNMRFLADIADYIIERRH